MRNRILFAFGGIVFGVLLSAPVQDWMKLSPAIATAACAAGGLIFGILISVLVDAFSVQPEEPTENHEI